MDTQFFTPDGSAPEPYFLVVSALVPYKRIDVAIRAAARIGARLKVVGTGPDRERLAREAGPNVEFVGALTGEALRAAYRGTTALVLPAEEDFGIAPVEAMACGRPVVALARGGATETVRPGETGWLVADQTPEAFADAMRVAAATPLDPQHLAAHAARFSAQAFDAAFSRIVDAAIQGRAC